MSVDIEELGFVRKNVAIKKLSFALIMDGSITPTAR